MARFVQFDGRIHEVASDATLDAARVCWGDALSQMPVWATPSCTDAPTYVATLTDAALVGPVLAEYARMSRMAATRATSPNYAGF